MEKLIERISVYEILNNIIPGTIYVILVEKMTFFRIRTNNIWLDIVLYYFIGLIIGRVGSLVIERFLKRIKWVQFSPYSEYVKAEQKDFRVREMTTINNMYRTYASVALCFLFTEVCSQIWTITQGMNWKGLVARYVLGIVLLVLFIISYFKQTKYVYDRVDTINKANKEKNIILPEKENN